MVHTNRLIKVTGTNPHRIAHTHTHTHTHTHPESMINVCFQYKYWPNKCLFCYSWDQNTSRLRYTYILLYVRTLTYITLQVLLAEMTYILPQSTQINCNLGLSVWLRYTSACLQEEPEIKSPMICNVMLLPQVQFVTNMTDYKSQPEFSTFYVDVPEIL